MKNISKCKFAILLAASVSLCSCGSSRNAAQPTSSEASQQTSAAPSSSKQASSSASASSASSSQASSSASSSSEASSSEYDQTTIADIGYLKDALTAYCAADAIDIGLSETNMDLTVSEVGITSSAPVEYCRKNVSGKLIVRGCKTDEKSDINNVFSLSASSVSTSEATFTPKLDMYIKGGDAYCNWDSLDDEKDTYKSLTCCFSQSVLGIGMFGDGKTIVKDALARDYFYSYDQFLLEKVSAMTAAAKPSWLTFSDSLSGHKATIAFEGKENGAEIFSGMPNIRDEIGGPKQVSLSFTDKTKGTIVIDYTDVAIRSVAFDLTANATFDSETYVENVALKGRADFSYGGEAIDWSKISLDGYTEAAYL